MLFIDLLQPNADWTKRTKDITSDVYFARTVTASACEAHGEFACNSKACAPPPVGTGGSLPTAVQHVTSREAAALIKKGGFLVGRGEMHGSLFGNGIYLSMAGDKMATRLYKKGTEYEGHAPALVRGTVRLKRSLKVSGDTQDEVYDDIVRELGGKKAVQEAARSSYDRLRDGAKSALKKVLGDGAVAKVDWDGEFETDPVFNDMTSEQYADFVAAVNPFLPHGLASFGDLRDIKSLRNAAEGNLAKFPTKNLANLVADLGYDGIEITNPSSTPAVGGSQIVVFDPKAITVESVEDFGALIERFGIEVTLDYTPVGFACEEHGEFACNDRSCAPPPVGTGGSRPSSRGKFQPRNGADPEPYAQEVENETVRNPYTGELDMDQISESEAAWKRRMPKNPVVRIRVPTSALKGIARSGRLKTQHEVNESGGTYAPELRRENESRMFGEGLRGAPLYGYLAKAGSTTTFSDRLKPTNPYAGGSEVGQYGEIVIELKKGLHDRVTVTMGDSFETDTAAIPLVDVWRATPIRRAASFNGNERYIEAQIHQRVLMDRDVERIYIPANLVDDDGESVGDQIRNLFPNVEVVELPDEVAREFSACEEHGEFACTSRSCAPPPVGTGGSISTGIGSLARSALKGGVAALYAAKGFNAKPQVVSDTQFGHLIRQGKVRESWRGISLAGSERSVPESVSRAYERADEHPVIEGTFGSGTYVAFGKNGEREARQYAGKGGAVLRIGIPPKMGSEPVLRQVTEVVDRLARGGEGVKAFEPRNIAQGARLYQSLRDAGIDDDGVRRLARDAAVIGMLLGWDGVYVSDGAGESVGYALVWNRGATVVSPDVLTASVTIGFVDGALATACDACGEFACSSKACAPPPIGTGGSLPSGGLSSISKAIKGDQNLAVLRASAGGDPRTMTVTTETMRSVIRVGRMAREAILGRLASMDDDPVVIPRKIDTLTSKGKEKVREITTKHEKSVRDTYKKEIIASLNEVRRFGGKAEVEMYDENVPMRSVLNELREGLKGLPSAWINTSNKAGDIVVLRDGRRAMYEPDSVNLTLNNDPDAARHEMTHRMEYVVPGIRALEAAFYEMRASGNMVKLNSLMPSKGYADSEITDPDEYWDSYVGKDYKGQAYEIMSMGTQYVFEHLARIEQLRRKVAKAGHTGSEFDRQLASSRRVANVMDDEFIDFVLGTMLTVGWEE